MENQFAHNVLGVSFRRGEIRQGDIRKNATEYHLEMLHLVMKWGKKRERRRLPEEFLKKLAEVMEMPSVRSQIRERARIDREEYSRRYGFGPSSSSVSVPAPPPPVTPQSSNPSSRQSTPPPPPPPPSVQVTLSRGVRRIVQTSYTETTTSPTAMRGSSPAPGREWQSQWWDSSASAASEGWGWQQSGWSCYQ